MITSTKRAPILLLIVAAGAMAACARHRGASEVTDSGAVSLDVQSLWKKEAATDPITAYKVRLATDPDNPGLHNNLGNAYVHENLMDDAIREFRTAARLDRTSAVPWNNLGTTYKKMGKMLRAQDSFERALRLDDRYALAYYNLGTLYDEKGQYDMAMDLYLKALALKPELAEVKFNPQVVENKHIAVVKLRHFLEESGNISLPLDRLPE